MHKLQHLSLLLLAMAVSHSSSADQAESFLRVVCAMQAPICAKSDTRTNTTVVSKSDPATRTQQVIWSFPSWLQVVRVNESGQVILVETKRFNQLSGNENLESVVLQLYTSAGLGREFVLKEFFKSEQELQAARKGGAWAKAEGSDDSDVAQYTLASGRKLRITLSTGMVNLE